jgi:predicted protein tyrosine phosphatase
MSSWLRDEQGLDDNDDDDDDDDDEPRAPTAARTAPRASSKKKTATPQSKLRLEGPLLEAFSGTLRGDDLMRQLEAQQPVAFAVNGCAVSATVPRLYPSAAVAIKCVDAGYQKLADDMLRKHTKQRPAMLSAILKALSALPAPAVPASRNDDDDDNDGTNNDSAVAAPTVHSRPEDDEAILGLDFFEARQQNASLTLAQAVAVVCATLLDGKQKKLEKWLLQRQLRTESSQGVAAGGGRGRRSKDPTTGGFDERFCWMLMDLLGEGHDIHKLHQQFDSPLRPVAQFANLIVDGLYVGPLHAAQDDKFLFERARIGAIVSVGDFTPMFAHRGVAYLECVVRDRANEDIRPAIERCVAFIAEKRAAGVNVLVHCLGGRSRSATIVTAYLMLQHKMSLALALSTVVRQRPIVSPNLGFLRTLRTLEDLR